MKRIMAVCDVDPFYAERFAEFTNQREKVPFTAVAFSSVARLKAFAGEQPVELLLIGDEVDEEQLAGVKVGQIVRLSETGMADQKKSPVVYKYQSSEAVLREVMACYQVRPDQPPLTVVGVKCTVAGVYSPVSRCGKTGFCMTLGQVLARDSRVLCINLEEHSGLAKLTGSVYGGTLSDLIYYYRQGEYSRMRLGSVTYNWGGLDYVPPAAYAEDLAEIRGEELAGLIMQIAADGAYETILLDMGHLGRGMDPVLELCDVIYTPVKEDCVSAAKLEEWREYLEISGRPYVWEKVQLMKLPGMGTVPQPETYFEQLLWGEMGDLVRGMVKGTRGGDG